MSRKLVSFILVAFVIAAMFSIVRVATLIEGHVTEDTSLEARDIKVGAYYYVWYNGCKHNNVIDDPIIGWSNYWSNDSKVIKKHLSWFDELGLDFLIISWWGTNSFEDNAAKMVFQTVKSESSKISLAIMVEPFNETGTYNFTYIYNYIYDNFVVPYRENYMTLYNRSLLCIFNGENITKDGKIQLDNRFEIRIVGSTLRPHIHWEYEVPTVSTHPLCMDGEISVIPRYDAYGWKCDITYSEGLYDKQWNDVLSYAREEKVNIVTIISWNEFAERTSIEPHYDATAYDLDPYFLYNETKAYINRLKGSFADFSEEIFEDVKGPSENQCRYNAVDSKNYRLDAIKIIENPNGGYLGIYHFDPGGIYQVMLANSTDLLHWVYIETIEQNASMPTIAETTNGAFIVGFDKHINGSHSLGFHYYPNVTSLLEHSPELNFTVPHTLGNSSGLEGTPNFYSATIIESELLSICVGFHYNNGTKDNLGWDRVAIGSLNITLNPPRYQGWEVKPFEQYNKKIEQLDVKGHIGDRDYGQIFGRNFTLQEANLLPPEEEAVNRTRYWASWRVFLHDYSTGNFSKLSIATHFNATSFGNPTFTFLKSPNNKTCIVVTYFLFREGLPDNYKDKAGELIFCKEFKTEPFPLTYENESYSVNVTSNSTIPNFNFNRAERSISFNVTGVKNSKGFFIMEIPKKLVQSLWQCNYTVLLDGKQWSFENWTYTENIYIYTNYIHSEHEVVIIPEFPSFLILPLLMITTLLAIIIYKRKQTN
jgi:hypothetical protein